MSLYTPLPSSAEYLRWLMRVHLKKRLKQNNGKCGYPRRSKLGEKIRMYRYRLQGQTQVFNFIYKFQLKRKQLFFFRELHCLLGK